MELYVAAELHSELHSPAHIYNAIYLAEFAVLASARKLSVSEFHYSPSEPASFDVYVARKPRSIVSGSPRQLAIANRNA